MSPRAQKLLLSAGTALSVWQVALVFFTRYLPMYDYPIWLFEVDRMSALLQGDASVAGVYTFVFAPVPNAGLVGAIYLLSRIVDVETAGKIILAVCIAGLPWVWYWSVRRIRGTASGLAFLGFPFAFNLFFWGRDGYLLALIALIGAVGWVVGALRTPDRRISVALAAIGPIMYFLHGAVFSIWALVVITLAVRSARPAAERIRWVAGGVLPGIALFVWYGLTAAQSSPDAGVTWGAAVLARNLVKPMLLFIKSYGIASPFPLTIANALWLTVLVAAAGVSAGRIHLRRIINEPLAPVLAACMLGALLLPDMAFGIVSPGEYCVLPALFLAVILVPERSQVRWIPVAFMASALAVTVHASVHASRVDDMMSACVNDTRTCMKPDGPHMVLRYDWPAEAGPWNALSASVNPLFGAQYYALLRAPGIAWIHGTAFLRLRENHAWLRTAYAGATREDFHASVVRGIGALDRFQTVMIAGSNPEATEITRMLESRGFRPVCSRPLWTILARQPAAQWSTP